MAGCREDLRVTPADRNLFRGTASYYARFRPGYPEAFFRRVIEYFALDGSGRMLDLGCGTGQMLIPLAPHVAEAIGMDPLPEMLDEAARQAARAGVSNATWIEGGSWDLERLHARLGALRLTTMGRSFHWMDGDATLQTLHALTEPRGGVVVATDTCGFWGGNAPWQQAITRTIQHWLGEQQRAGSGTRPPAQDPWAVILERSPFGDIEHFQATYTRALDIDQILGHLYSTSFCSLTVLGDKREGFERDLRSALLEIEGAGQFTEELYFEAFLARRTGKG
jgi:SAM-dependent methyltransferase